MPKEPTEEDLWKELADAESGEENPELAEATEGSNDASADQGAAPAQEPPADQPDIWANAPADLKAAHDAQVKALESATTEHARRSIEGRINAYTRRLRERSEAAAQQPAAPTTEEAADPLEELAAEYPEIAKPLREKLAPIAEKLSQFDAQMRSRQEAADQQMDAELQANEAMLEAKHPGWDAYLKENGPAFSSWIMDQPLALRQAFVVNQDAIIDPYSAIMTLDAFKSFVATNKQPSQAAGQPAPAVPQQTLNPKRAAQLAGSASPHSSGSRPTVSGIPQEADDQVLWNAWRDIDPDEKKWRNA